MATGNAELAIADSNFFAAQNAHLLNICKRCEINGTDFDVCWDCMTESERNEI